MLRLEHISKSYPGVKALQDVSLEFKKGEVHALCGENGAGKSTLMNIIMGNTQADEGKIFWNDQQIKNQDVLAAQSWGFSIVYQERTLADSLTVAENIFPVNLPLTRSRLIDYKMLYARTKTLLADLHLTTLSPTTIVSKLSVPQKQMLEIAKAIAQQPSLLILDEPTASLADSETRILFQIIRKLKASGVTIIYISHRMAEIEEIADVVSVLKDGKYVGTVAGKTRPEKIVVMMVGRELQKIGYTNYARNPIKLRVQNISGKNFSNISFEIHEGEIMGLAGLEGSGRTSVNSFLQPGGKKILCY